MRQTTVLSDWLEILWCEVILPGKLDTLSDNENLPRYCFEICDNVLIKTGLVLKDTL